MKRILLYVLCIALLFCGCAQDPVSPEPGDDRPSIVVTVFPAYDFCRELTRGLPDGSVELILLGRNGKDMHSYEPSAADIVELARADLLVCVGGGTEAWVDATLEAADNPALRVFYMMEACETSTELHDGEVCEDHDHDHDHDHAYLHQHGIPHTHGHVHENQKAVNNRLARAIGHLEKVKRMVEDGQDCSDVLVQLAAVRSALDNTGKVILKDHMRHCMVDAVAAGDHDAIDDLCDAIDKLMK